MATQRLSQTEEAAWVGFIRTHAELWRRMEKRLARSGLTLTDYDVLVALESAGDEGVRMAELAKRSGLTTGGFTRLADRMTRRGLVERRPCATDGRGFLITITPEGRRALRDARTTHLDDVRQLYLSHLGADDMAKLAAIWQRLLSAADELPPE